MQKNKNIGLQKFGTIFVTGFQFNHVKIVFATVTGRKIFF